MSTQIFSRWSWKRVFRALVVYGVASAGCAFLDTDERPIAEGKPHDDPILMEVLRPAEPIETERLLSDSRKFLTYEARFERAPPSNYLEQYAKLLTRRGVLVRAIGSSPHAIPPRVFGYETLVLRRMTPDPFTIRITEFSTKDYAWLGRNRWYNAPKPIHVDGAVLTFRLGRQRTAWTDRVLVPAGDVEHVAEFPLSRFPGAVVTVVEHPSDHHLLDSDNLHRGYLARGVTMSQVVSHYAAELRRLGVDYSGREGDDYLNWSGPAVEGMTKLVVSRASLSVVPGSGLGLSDLRKWVPGLFDGLPDDLLPYMVNLEFSDSEERLRYLSPSDRQRYEELRAGEK